MTTAASRETSEVARPFLKWTGGKQWLARFRERLLLPQFRGRYFEPFVGGGALFFSFMPRAAVLSDINAELINVYQVIQNDPELLIRTLERIRHTPVLFEEMRAKKGRNANTRAARFVYLNKTAFNGIYRVNRDGQFNVPLGRYDNPGICQPDRIRAASAALRRIRLQVGDFQGVVAAAQAGDFVYLDPPYITGHSNNGFLKYNATLFSWQDQLRLSATATALLDRGVTVLASNADHGAIRALYQHFYLYRMQRKSLIGVQSTRGTAHELLISSRLIEGLEASLING